MRAYIDSRSVAVSEHNVRAFACFWPCSGLRGLRGVTFTYEDNGDLVDIAYRNGSSDDWDGPALVALSQDAQEYLNARILARDGKRCIGCKRGRVLPGEGTDYCEACCREDQGP